MIKYLGIQKKSGNDTADPKIAVHISKHYLSSIWGTNPPQDSNEEYDVAVESSKDVQKCEILQWINNWWGQNVFPSYILGNSTGLSKNKENATLHILQYRAINGPQSADKNMDSHYHHQQI